MKISFEQAVMRKDVWVCRLGDRIIPLSVVFNFFNAVIFFAIIGLAYMIGNVDRAEQLKWVAFFAKNGVVDTQGNIIECHPAIVENRTIAWNCGKKEFLYNNTIPGWN